MVKIFCALILYKHLRLLKQKPLVIQVMPTEKGHVSTIGSLGVRMLLHMKLQVAFTTTTRKHDRKILVARLSHYPCASYETIVTISPLFSLCRRFCTPALVLHLCFKTSNIFSPEFVFMGVAMMREKGGLVVVVGSEDYGDRGVKEPKSN